MVTVLKHRIALAVLVGVLVIPVLSVNNGGLSHLLFCEAPVAQSFAVGTGDGAGTEVTSSTRLDRDEPSTVFEGQAAVTEVCDGVRVEVSASPLDSGRVDLTAAIGEVPSGERGSATMELRIPEGQTEIAGTLLLGP